jgi:LuxR family transcriptional regulator, maltose regulon positive regulatory protein
MATLTPAGTARVDLLPIERAAAGKRRARRRERLAGQAIHRPGLISRPALVERLVTAPPASAILVVAPAGYGKSRLLAEWADSDRRPFVWLRLVPADDDPVRLAECLADGLSSVGIEIALPSAPGALVQELPRAVRRSDRTFVLVLDDVDKLRRRATLQLLADLIDSLGPRGHVALAARYEPALPVARLRTERRLVEIGTPDLVLTRDEVAAMATANGLDLDEAGRDFLMRRTEGWPAGVYLAALAARADPVPSRSLASFSGADRHVTEYLQAEVLSALPRRLMDFLKRGSILTRLSAPACDYVLERHDSGRVLFELSRTNLLVVPLDRTDTEYRYHALLAEALRSDLRREDPETEAALQARASSWYERHDDPDMAIQHALAAGDAERAGRLLWREAPTLIAYGRRDAVADHLRCFSRQQIVSSPPLALTTAFVRLAFGDRAGAERWVATALQVMSADADRHDKPSLEAGLYAIHALVAAADLEEMHADAVRAYAAAGDDGPWRSLACLAAGVALQLSGDATAARRSLSEGARRGAAAAPVAQVLCLAQLASMAIDDGDWDAAETHIAHARAQTERVALRDYPAAAVVFATSAAVRAHVGQVDLCERDGRRASRLLLGLTGFTPWYVAECRIALARAALRLGDIPRAQQLLAEAGRELRALPEARTLHASLQACRDHSVLAAASREMGSETLTSAELRVLQFLPTHLSFPEIADQLYVSRNTVKTHVQAVYRKLMVSCRSEAVTRAREAGLLEPVA